jgi:hypothetical protein
LAAEQCRESREKYHKQALVRAKTSLQTPLSFLTQKVSPQVEAKFGFGVEELLSANNNQGKNPQTHARKYQIRALAIYKYL